MASPTNKNMDQLREIAHQAMLRYGFLPDFSPQVQAEIDKAHPAVAGKDSAVKDLRSLLWCSIDNDDSKDLDQLSVAVPGKDGTTRILVAIADVDATVKRGSATDAHARQNTTSVYTAAEVFPMLPKKLSYDVTSLADQQERLAIVADYAVTSDGRISGGDVYRATVLNRAKLAYDSVAAWLDQKGPIPAAIKAVPGMDAQLRLQDQVATAMKDRRHEAGALSLETHQVRAVFAGEILADLRPDLPNRAKQLIEDFMVAANGVIARFLEKKGLPSLRRVLKSPERWARIQKLAGDVGEALPPAPDANALETFLCKRRKADPSTFADLSFSVVKLLGKGEYELEIPGEKPIGHFALAVRDYTHSTAPNRRFPDLVTQRLIKSALDGKPAAYTKEELAPIAAHCTEAENNAAKVERQVLKSAAAQLLVSRHGQKFDAIVTGVSPKGTWVRVNAPEVEGKLVQGEAGLDVGDRLRVELLRADVVQGFIDFGRVK